MKRASAAIDLLATLRTTLLIVDLMLPEIGGDELLGYLELTQPKYLRRVVVTTASPGRMNCEFLRRILPSAIARYYANRFPEDAVVLQKPFELGRVEEVLRSLDVK